MAEFLYYCVRETIEGVFPEEILYLESNDQMKKSINELFNMPNHLTDLLIRFLEQNNGVLSKRVREKEFKALLDSECKNIEQLYKKIFKP